MQVVHIAYVRSLQNVLANGVQIESGGGCLQQHPAGIPQQYPGPRQDEGADEQRDNRIGAGPAGRRDNDCRNDHRSASFKTSRKAARRFRLDSRLAASTTMQTALPIRPMSPNRSMSVEAISGGWCKRRIPSTMTFRPTANSSSA